MCPGQRPACPFLPRSSCRRAWSASCFSGASGIVLRFSSHTVPIQRCTRRLASPFFCACHIIPHIYVAHIVRQFVPTQESPLQPGMLAFPSPACAVSDRAEAIMACRRCVACHGCRHPASGYVQGINDLVTPFLAVFLSPHMEGSVEDQTDTDFPEEVPPVSRLSPHSSCSQHTWSLLPFRGKAPESSNSQGGCTVSACFRHCCQWHVWSAVISSRTACLQASMLLWHSLHAVVVSKLFSVCR